MRLKAPLIAISVLLIASSVYFLAIGNAEFLLYVAVVAFFAYVIYHSDRHLHWPSSLVWLLFAWAVLHMAGGGVTINGHVLYAQMLIPIIGEPYLILKYDQVVHAFGFFVATLVMFHVLRPHLKPRYGPVAIGLTIFAAGLGLSAINEIVEFAAVVLIPETNVGGYVNTALDLCFNALGAGAASVLAIKRDLQSRGRK